jgi:hypothetical protein
MSARTSAFVSLTEAGHWEGTSSSASAHGPCSFAHGVQPWRWTS